MFRRIPKRGFSNVRFATRYTVVNVEALERAFPANTHVTAQALLEAGLIRTLGGPVKILGQGTLTKKLIVDAAMFSKTATDKIQKAGGETRVGV
jgi:large subunit ribosomal protein L15